MPNCGIVGVLSQVSSVCFTVTLEEAPVPPKNLIRVKNRVFGHLRGHLQLTLPRLRLRS